MHTFLVTCCCSDLVTKSFSKAGGRVLQLGAAAEEGEEPGRSLDAFGLAVEAPSALEHPGMRTSRTGGFLQPNLHKTSAPPEPQSCPPRRPEKLTFASFGHFAPSTSCCHAAAGILLEMLISSSCPAGYRIGSSPALFRVPGNTSVAANSTSSRPSAQGSGPGPQEARRLPSTLRRSTWAGTD